MHTMQILRVKEIARDVEQVSPEYRAAEEELSSATLAWNETSQALEFLTSNGRQLPFWYRIGRREELVCSLGWQPTKEETVELISPAELVAWKIVTAYPGWD